MGSRLALVVGASAASGEGLGWAATRNLRILTTIDTHTISRLVSCEAFLLNTNYITLLVQDLRLLASLQRLL